MSYESDKSDKENTDADREQWFEDGFHNWIQSNLAAERCKRNGEEVPANVQAGLEKAKAWLDGLTADEYSRLIH